MASVCAARAKSNWKSTAGWPKRRFTICEWSLQSLERRKERKLPRAATARPCHSAATPTPAEHVDERLTGSDEYAKDQLFATLVYAHAALAFARLGARIARDTVGFIRDLPHSWSPASRRRSKRRGKPTCCCTWPTRATARAETDRLSLPRCSKNSHPGQRYVAGAQQGRAVPDRGALDRLLGLYPMPCR